MSKIGRVAKKKWSDYIMELRATNTHYKHQSGMEKQDQLPKTNTQLKRRSGNWTLFKTKR